MLNLDLFELKLVMLMQMCVLAATESVMRLVVEWTEVDGFVLAAVTYGDDEGEKISQNDLLLLSKEEVIVECRYKTFTKT